MEVSKYVPKVTTILISLFIVIFALDKFVFKGIMFEWGALKKDNVIIKLEYWRVITAPFFHTGFIHLFVNIIGLYFTGLFIERKIGNIEFLIIFLVGNIIANMVFTFVFFFESSIGASAGIYALIGVALVVCFKDKNFFKIHLNTWEMNTSLIYFILGNFKGVDTLFVHSVGFISGIIISIVWNIICS